MTFWQAPLKPALAALVLAAGIAGRPEPAQALPGVGLHGGAAVHFADTGWAYQANATADVMGWGLGAMYWTQPGVPTATNWLQATVRRNVSPIPMTSIVPGLGVAMIGTGTQNDLGPLLTLSGSFQPILLPTAVDANVGLAWVNGSMALPYSLGVKLSLIPFTALVARWRGWEGNSRIRNGGPELGVEIGI